MRSEIQGLRDEMRKEMQELRNDNARLDHKIDKVARDLTIRMGGMLILLFGALASIKFFG